MSIRIMNAVWDLRAGSMSTAQRFVLLALADTANDEGHCWPSVEYIADKVGLRDRQTRDHLDALESAGWFSRHRRVRGWRATGYEYDIDVEKLHEYRRKPATSTGGNQPVSERRKPAGSDRRKPAGLIQNRQSRTTSMEPPATTSAAAVKPNQFDGLCVSCGCVVEAGTGKLVGKKASHLPGKCATPPGAPLKVTSSKMYGRTTDEEWT